MDNSTSDLLVESSDRNLETTPVSLPPSLTQTLKHLNLMTRSRGPKKIRSYLAFFELKSPIYCSANLPHSIADYPSPSSIRYPSPSTSPLAR